MKDSYSLKTDGFSAYWFEGSKHKDKAIIWMHGSGMNEKHCLADSKYLRDAGYSVLVLGFYFWKGMSKKMRAIPVEYVESAVTEFSLLFVLLFRNTAAPLRNGCIAVCSVNQ